MKIVFKRPDNGMLIVLSFTWRSVETKINDATIAEGKMILILMKAACINN